MVQTIPIYTMHKTAVTLRRSLRRLEQMTTVKWWGTHALDLNTCVPRTLPQWTWWEQVLAVMSLSTSCYKMTSGSVAPISGRYTPILHTQAHTNTHWCYFPNYILLSIPLVFQGVSQLSECKRGIWQQWSSHVCECRGVYTSILYSATVNTQPCVWDGVRRWCRCSHWWINVSNHSLHYAVSSQGHDPAASSCSCNSLHLLHSINFTICLSVIRVHFCFHHPFQDEQMLGHFNWQDRETKGKFINHYVNRISLFILKEFHFQTLSDNRQWLGKEQS